jgi:hypothetical protein
MEGLMGIFGRLAVFCVRGKGVLSWCFVFSSSISYESREFWLQGVCLFWNRVEFVVMVWELALLGMGLLSRLIFLVPSFDILDIFTRVEPLAT